MGVTRGTLGLGKFITAFLKKDIEGKDNKPKKSPKIMKKMN